MCCDHVASRVPQFNRWWLCTGALLRIFVYRGRVTIEFASPHLPKCASRCLTCHRFDAVPCGTPVAEFAGEVVVALTVVKKGTELKVDITNQCQQPRVGHLKAERTS